MAKSKTKARASKRRNKMQNQQNQTIPSTATSSTVPSPAPASSVPASEHGFDFGAIDHNYSDGSAAEDDTSETAVGHQRDRNDNHERTSFPEEDDAGAFEDLTAAGMLLSLADRQESANASHDTNTQHAGHTLYRLNNLPSESFGEPPTQAAPEPGPAIDNLPTDQETGTYTVQNPPSVAFAEFAASSLGQDFVRKGLQSGAFSFVNVDENGNPVVRVNEDTAQAEADLPEPLSNTTFTRSRLPDPILQQVLSDPAFRNSAVIEILRSLNKVNRGDPAAVRAAKLEVEWRHHLNTRRLAPAQVQQIEELLTAARTHRGLIARIQQWFNEHPDAIRRATRRVTGAGITVEEATQLLVMQDEVAALEEFIDGIVDGQSR